MKSDEFVKIRKKLGLTRAQLAVDLGDGDTCYSLRAVGSWEDGTNAIPPAVGKIMKLMLKVAKN